uniref:Uncharacterized protein n=1 Tax=uncultured Prochlorococcus marinus clone HOT0M-10G7 TaxID=379385 RepID=Q1PJJ8_PROMR|nr:hypothetical protein HOT0M-10G7_0021 [uncultured Prochlorococcus marinus clone HOT0M-10G7]
MKKKKFVQVAAAFVPANAKTVKNVHLAKITNFKFLN